MIIATRSSPLARWQAEAVANRLALSAIDVEFLIVTTEGDQDQTRQIQEMAGRGVFVKEVQMAVLEGQADLAVHSAKDLMSSPTAGLNLAAFLERGDPRDALIGMNLRQLPQGARIATGSARRQAQLAHVRPDLKFTGLRGNMETRIAVAEQEDVDAVVVAMAALQRLELTNSVAEILSVEEMIPQVGQGAIAVECRDDDPTIHEQLLGISDEPTRRCVEAERAYLAQLGGGCELPVGAHAYLKEGIIQLDAVLASRDGTTLLRTQQQGYDADALGKAVAEELLADGGRALLSINGASP
ncbi:MAG: hydroxymethylbilane synthase [Acidimicrobiales bacterium]|nr:hydroxymethylbilane synthase [Acidimicrobiales bacterium]